LVDSPNLANNLYYSYIQYQNIVRDFLQPSQEGCQDHPSKIPRSKSTDFIHLVQEKPPFKSEEEFIQKEKLFLKNNFSTI
jgi:hypothetical protein